MNLTVRVKPLSTGKNGKVMVVIGKGVAQKASLRNLIKRRIRSVLAPESRRLGSDLTVTVRPSAAGMEFSELKRELMEQIAEHKK